MLKGESKITITNESMAALYLLSNATISGADSNSKLTIESTGKNNKGIRAAAALTISGTSLTIVDKTTAAASKGYMLGILSSGNLSMTNVKYTATGVLAAIDFDANCTSTLTNVEFQVSCTANQSFDIDDPTTVAIGVHMMKPASGKNTITGCSGSITAQIPLYVDGETELKNSNLTLTTDNYYAINLNNNLTISGGTVNLKSTGSGAYGFYLKNASKLVFADSTNVTLAVDSVGIKVKTAAASVAINSGTVNMSPKAGAAKPIGIYNCGTVTVSGGSLITTGIYSAIQNLGAVSFSGGTHTLNTSDSGVCYIDDASDDTLSISGNANVTLSGGAMNKLNGTLNVSGGALTISGTKTYGILLNGILNVTGGTMNVRDTQNYGIVVQGTLKQSGGTMNIRDIQKSGSNSPACIAVLKKSGAYRRHPEYQRHHNRYDR